MLDYIRIACAVPETVVGDVRENTARICEKIRQADKRGADLVVFPELAVTGYSCADLFFQESLIRGAALALGEIAEYTRQFPELTAVVGAPVEISGSLYNCAAVISSGAVRGLVPKTFLPNNGEFYEKRWFSSGNGLLEKWIPEEKLGLSGQNLIPVGNDLLFSLGEGTVLGVEICEDLWAPIPPSSHLALRGAQVIVNLSASNEIAGKRKFRREMVLRQSACCGCIYAYCSAGSGESTQDLVFSGHSLVCESGNLLRESEDCVQRESLLIHDADLGKVRADRRQNKSFADAAAMAREPVRTVETGVGSLRGDGETYPVRKLPFVPSSQKDRLERCLEIFELQAEGLARRLEVLGCDAVIGVSGGLDSTLALLVSVEAMRRVGGSPDQVHGVTMPCFGTSDRTYGNALALMESLGVHCKEIPIRDAVSAHFRDIGHDPDCQNGVYENAQARERTQILMDYAGEVGGIVVGTGDLSELALGWCTYNGDHMSMYGVNASIPKTLIRWMIESISVRQEYAAAREILEDILDTPISPELLPPDAQGRIQQQTEDLVGPYALHDFFLYYMLRFGFSPEKIYTLACRAFGEDFSPETVKRWMKVFYRRFFTQQFKRDCMPDGVKVGTVGLCPRGDWRMPSDASGRLWLEEIEKM